ncbi:uncharacterized protein LOC142618427 isoform X6 [Castanea sativa]|uniref:uncharacterized protein LOC142618427 isoform X6 n=1 Tax=Castanea sativa TaxID=21020 RepID=UPI003F64DA9E
MELRTNRPRRSTSRQTVKLHSSQLCINYCSRWEGWHAYPLKVTRQVLQDSWLSFWIQSQGKGSLGKSSFIPFNQLWRWCNLVWSQLLGHRQAATLITQPPNASQFSISFNTAGTVSVIENNGTVFVIENND